MLICVTHFFTVVLNFTAFCDAYAVYRQYTGTLQKNGMHSFVSNVITENALKILLSIEGRNKIN